MARAYGDVWLSSGIAGLFFIYLELLKLSREHLFTGASPGEWVSELPPAFAMYVLATGLAGTVLFASLRITAPRLSDSLFVARVLGLCGAGLVWAVVSAYREQAPNIDDVLVITALMSLTVVLAGLPRFVPMGRYSVSMAATVACLAGIMGVIAAGDVFLLRANRAFLVTAVCGGWLALAGVVSLCLWGFGRSFRLRAVRILFSVVLIIAPLSIPASIRALRTLSERATGPNIVLIESDALRADYVASDQLMPIINALGARGTAFTQNRAVASWTLPAVLGQMTSTYPPSAQPGEIWNYHVREQDRPLAECLAEQGYETCAIIANPVLYGMPGLLRGFHETYTSHHLVLTKQGPFRLTPLLQHLVSQILPSLYETHFSDSTQNATDYALAYLRSHKGKKFFLWLYYMDPHAPLDPPVRYRAVDGPWPLFWPYAIQQQWGCPNIGDGEMVKEEDRPYVRSLYQAETRYIDDSVGTLLDYVNRSGLTENTHVCFTADHGEEMWEHGLWGHGYSMYEEVVRVPWLIAGPRIRSQVLTTPVSALDLAPTLAGLAGISPDASWNGVNLAPALCDGAAVPQRSCFARGCMTGPQIDPLEMAISQQNKLIRNTRTGQMQLFDVDQDPGEQHDLSGERPDTVQTLTDLLDQWRASSSSSMDEYYGTTATPEELENTVRRLRAVGYL